MEPEIVADYQCLLGEGPLWHQSEKLLYWCDIDARSIFGYRHRTRTHQKIFQGAAVSGITQQKDGALLFFLEGGLVKEWRGGRATPVAEIPEERETRFNDVIADPSGRVFCGTMPTAGRLGRLYRLDCDGRFERILEGLGCPNGMGFSPDLRCFYFTESTSRRIYRFDYDQSSGALANQQVLVQVSENDGIPDGLTVDADGFIWSARWDGACLTRHSPDGREERRIHFPARKITSITFGGEHYRDMFVTSAGGEDKHNEGRAAGALFHVNLGITGRPEFHSKIFCNS